MSPRSRTRSPQVPDDDTPARDPSHHPREPVHRHGAARPRPSNQNRMPHSSRDDAPIVRVSLFSLNRADGGFCSRKISDGGRGRAHSRDRLRSVRQRGMLGEKS